MGDPRKRDEAGRFVSKHADERYDVSVWNTFNGDHVRQFWDVPYEEVAEIEAQYRDDPEFDVVVEPRF